MAMESASSSSLPWELIVDLTSQFLDPKSLAMASCVSKSWNSAAASEQLWSSLCLSHYPSSRHLMTDKTNSSRQLFALLHSSSIHRRRFGTRSKPKISFSDIIFTVDVFRSGGKLALSMAKPGEELIEEGGKGIVRFDIDIEKGAAPVELEIGEEVSVTWMMVMKGWGGAFSMMEREGKGRLVEGDEVWFSEELPAGPGQYCCPSIGGGGGLVAEFGLRLCSGGFSGRRRRVGRVSLGVMSVVEWRYVGLEDGLLYMQQFLLPNSNQ